MQGITGRQTPKLEQFWSWLVIVLAVLGSADVARALGREFADLGVAVSGARAGQPTLRLVSGDALLPEDSATLPEEPVAEVCGINLYGKQRVHGRDRKQLERLARYTTRPPIAEERLSRRSDGTLFLEFKKTWRDGTRGLVFTPEDLIVRLCAAVPPPFFHLVRYFGVLSSHSSHRASVVPAPKEEPAAHRAPLALGDQLEFLAVLGEKRDAPAPSARRRWAWLLSHVFGADLEHCPKCGGPMRFAQVAKTENAARRLMVKLGLAPHPPPAPPRAPLGQLSFGF